MKIVYYLPDTKNPFWKQVITGAKDRGKERSIEIEPVSANHDESLQIEQLESYAEKQAKGIFISPAGMTSISRTCRSIFNAGIPIIAIDQHMSGDVTASVISANLKGGIMAGKYIADQLGHQGTLVHIQAEQHLQNASMRRKSFINEVARWGLAIVMTIQAESSHQMAAEKMQAFLKKDIKFDAIFAENDAMALGAIDALSRANFTPWPTIVGYDGVEEALDAIRSDKMAATIVQKPRAMGEKSMEVMMKIINKQAFDELTIVQPKLTTKEQL